jgi:hypothetical protein
MAGRKLRYMVLTIASVPKPMAPTLSARPDGPVGLVDADALEGCGFPGQGLVFREVQLPSSDGKDAPALRLELEGQPRFHVAVALEPTKLGHASDLVFGGMPMALSVQGLGSERLTYTLETPLCTVVGEARPAELRRGAGPKPGRVR